MNMRDLIPWGRDGGRSMSVLHDERASPLLALHHEMNRLFDEALRSFDTPFLFGRRPGWPNVEISETEKELRVTAEVPGLEEKDLEVTLLDGVLSISGERKSEVEDKERQFSERFYGRFERQIPLGVEVEEDNVTASYKNGILTVTMPKTAKAQTKAKRIAINGRS